MIRGHLEEEKPANSTPKNVARGASGGVLEGVLGVSEALGQGFWTQLKMMRQIKDDLGHIRNLMGPCWAVLVPFLDVLEGSWRHLGVILGYLGGSWEGLEASWRGFG